MRRTTLVFLAGALAVLLGIGLLLGSHALATHWESQGDGAWGGVTDLRMEGIYRLVGAAFLVFGLVLETMAFARWMRLDWLQRRRGAG